ncbi:MAG: CvpA family protein [Clostridia bacterium]|nr:CvpA family protein [Clostridia bacterium]
MSEPIIIHPVGEKRKKSVVGTLIGWVIYLLILAVVYWFTLPPIHWQSKEFWHFVLFALILRLVMSGFSVLKRAFTDEKAWNKDKVKDTVGSLGKLSKGFGIVALVIVLFLLVGNCIGFELFHAGSYANLLTTQTGDFAADVAELSQENIPVVDKDTAERLGLRKLGEISDLVSQFEVDETYYTQINYQGSPYRVTPLQYGDFFKWLGNRREGVPAYITVNMVTQETKLVRLSQGMKYSNSEYFMRYLPRHLRFQYPTKLFDNISFELDEQGTPYYVASTYSYSIGVFNGRDIDGAVLCNAITGDCEYYDKEHIPTWVDQVYSSDMILEQLTYNGKYQSGYWNSLFGQKGVLQPTDGHNYIAINDDVYLYTGITSAAGDESNVGFVLANLRTKDTSYYTCPGAEEYSAMESAQGMVQDLGYSATFPILLNVSDRPTYFVSLKDSAGLVKMYAYIDVQQYQVVGTGTTLQAAREAYAQKLKDETDIEIDPSGENVTQTVATLSGEVTHVASAVVEGNTYYYLKLKDHPQVFSVKVTVSEQLPFVKAGDKVELTVPHPLPEGSVPVSVFSLMQ